MIIEIWYDSDQGWDWGGGESLEAFSWGDDSGVELEKVGSKMYMVHSLRNWGRHDYQQVFYITDNEHEAIEKFVEELETLIENYLGFSEEEIAEALGIIEKYKEYSKDFERIKQVAEKLIAGEDPWEKMSTVEPAVREPSPLEVFEEFRQKFRTELCLSQDAMEWTKDLIEAYQPRGWGKSSLEVVSSCTYIVVKYKGYNIKKSQIASILQLSTDTVDAHCDDICSSLNLPRISSKRLFEEELKQYAFELRRLVNQGKSFYYISDNLNIEPKKLLRYLRRLGLECQSLGWGA